MISEINKLDNEQSDGEDVGQQDCRDGHRELGVAGRNNPEYISAICSKWKLTVRDLQLRVLCNPRHRRKQWTKYSGSKKNLMVIWASSSSYFNGNCAESVENSKGQLVCLSCSIQSCNRDVVCLCVEAHSQGRGDGGRLETADDEEDNSRKGDDSMRNKPVCLGRVQ